MWKRMVKKLAWESIRELVWWLIRAWVLPAILTGITIVWGWLDGVPLFYLWVLATIVFAVLGLTCSLIMLVYAMYRQGLHRLEIMTQDEYDASEKKENVIYFVGPAKDDAHSRT